MCAGSLPRAILARFLNTAVNLGLFVALSHIVNYDKGDGIMDLSWFGDLLQNAFDDKYFQKHGFLNTVIFLALDFYLNFNNAQINVEFILIDKFFL